MLSCNQTHWPRRLPPTACSCDKKLLQLGWQEKTKWEDGLRKTVDWCLNHASRDYWCAPAAAVQPGALVLALAALIRVPHAAPWAMRAWLAAGCHGTGAPPLAYHSLAGALLPRPAAPPCPLPPLLRRSHGDMELALEAHPTLQVPYMGSTTFAIKA